MKKNRRTRVSPLVWAACFGLLLSLGAPAALGAGNFSSPTADDSSVGEDSSVAEDSAPRTDAVIRIVIDVTNDNGGTRDPADFRPHINSFGYVSHGDVISLPTGDRTLFYWSRGGYDITDMRCVRTSDSALVSNAFTSIGVAKPQGLLRLDLNAGADLTCSMSVDDRQVALTVFPFIDGAPAQIELVTVVGDETFVGIEKIPVDAGLHRFTSGSPGYVIRTIECNKHYRISSGWRTFEPEFEIVTSAYETACVANFESTSLAHIYREFTFINNNGGELESGHSSLPPEFVSLEPGDHDIVGDAIDGYRMQSVTCVDRSDGSRVAIDDGSIQLGTGVSVTCSYVMNDIPSRITINNVFVDEYGGIATLADTAPNLNGVPVVNGKSNWINAGVHEVTQDRIPGYDQELVCETEVDDPEPSSSWVNVANDRRAICTFINTSIPAELTIRTEVRNNNGGTLSWGVPQPLLDGVLFAKWQAQAVEVGEHTLGVEPIDGYSLWKTQCWLVDEYGRLGSELPVVGDVVTLDHGERAECVLTLNDQPRKITVKSRFINNNGGSATTADATLLLGGAPVAHGSTHWVNDEVQTVEALALDGYVISGIRCVDVASGVEVEVVVGQVVVPNGHRIACTVTHNDIQSRVSVTTTVINDDDGTVEPNGIEVFVDARRALNNRAFGVNAGPRSFEYDDLPGYEVTSVECHHRSTLEDIPIVDGSIAVANGERIDCEVVYDDEPSS